MTDLAPCPACKRHVRIGVASCPFCAAALPVLRARNFAPGALTRAAIFTAALAGCQSKSNAPNPTAGSAAAGSAVQQVADDAAPAPVADAAEAMGSASGSAGSAAVADDAGIADAGVADDAGAGSGSAAAEALRKRKLDRLHQKRDKVDIERHMAKPYGAPPARRRIV